MWYNIERMIEQMDLSEIKVIKRDGREVSFDITKVQNALYKAFEEARPKNNKNAMKNSANAVAYLVHSYILDNNFEKMEVEEIQEIIKDKLLENLELKDVAKSFIEYSVMRKTIREDEMDLISGIKKLINGDKDIVNANANKDSKTFSTQRDLMAGQVAKTEGLRMLPKRVREAHLRGDIYFHDLDYSPFSAFTNCTLIDVKLMLENGFNMGNAVIGSPKSINTAVAQIAQIVANVASSMYGGTSINRIDEVLEPYAFMNYNKHIEEAELFNIPNPEYYAKNKTIKDIYDSMQSLEYEINTLYTSNGQTPFTTVGFGLSESWVGKEIQKAILNVRIGGLGVERKTAIFPY
jgi:ribonucleoside-triphosphate reductase (formate)